MKTPVFLYGNVYTTKKNLPTGALDVNTGNDIMNIFREIREEGKTVVIITHDINIAKKCDRILNIVDGKIVKMC